MTLHERLALSAARCTLPSDTSSSDSTPGGFPSAGGCSSRGRSLVAGRHVKVGEVVLSNEPLAACLLPQHCESRCAACFQVRRDEGDIQITPHLTSRASIDTPPTKVLASPLLLTTRLLLKSHLLSVILTTLPYGAHSVHPRTEESSCAAAGASAPSFAPATASSRRGVPGTAESATPKGHTVRRCRLASG